MVLRVPPDEGLIAALNELKANYKKNRANLIARWLELNGYATLDEAYEAYTNQQNSANSRPVSARSVHSLSDNSMISTAAGGHISFSSLPWSLQLECLVRHLAEGKDILRLLSIFIRRWGEEVNIERNENTRNLEQSAIRLLLSKLSSLEGSVLMTYLKTVSILAATPENQELVAKEGGIMLIFGSMIANVDVAAVQENACLALANLSTSEENASVIGREGGVLLLLGAMKRHKTDVTVVAHACSALGNLCLKPENKLIIAANDGHKLVLSMMESHPGQCRALEAACVVLANLGLDDSIASDMIACKGVSIIIQSLEDCITDSAVAAHTCAVLANLSRIESARKEIEQSAVPLIIDVVKCHPCSDSVMVNAFGLLRNIASNDRGREAVERAGSVSIAVRVLQGSSNSLHLITTVASFLRIVVTTVESAFELQQFGKEIIFSILQKYPGNVKIQQPLLTVIRNACLNGREFANILTPSEIKSILSALTNFPTNIQISEGTCTVLASVSPKKETFKLLLSEFSSDIHTFNVLVDVSRSYVVTVSSSMSPSHSSSSSSVAVVSVSASSSSSLAASLSTYTLLSSGIRSIFALVWNIISADPTNNQFEKYALIYFKFLQFELQPKIKEFPEAVLKSSMTLYLSLALTYDSIRAEIGPGHVHVIIDTTNRFISDLNTLRLSLKLLGMLTLDLNRSKDIVDQGGVALISRALNEHCNQGQIIASLCAFIGSLSLHEQNVNKIAISDIMGALVQNLTRFSSDASIQASGFAALGSIATKDIRAISSVNLIPLLCSALQTHPSNERVIVMACELIQLTSQHVVFQANEKDLLLSTLQRISSNLHQDSNKMVVMCIGKAITALSAAFVTAATVL